MADFGFVEKIANTGLGDDNSSSSRVREYYGRLNVWCNQAYEEAASLQKNVPEIKDIERSLDYLAGLQWKKEMASYKAKPVTNETLSMYFETIGLLTDIKPMFSITDISGTGKYSKTQEVLNILSKGWASRSNFEMRLAYITMFAMLTSAPAKIYWNPFAYGTSGDPSDADQTLEYIPPTSVLRLGEGDSYQDDELIIYRRVRTLDWIKRAYPTMGKYVKADQAKSKYTLDSSSPATVMPQFYQNLAPQMQRLIGGTEQVGLSSVYPKAEVQEFWMNDDSVNDTRNRIWMGPKGAFWGYLVEPGKKLYPRGRVIVRANNVTLYDQPNPYYHRKKPFAKAELYAVPWQSYAMSVVGPWTSQQDILNQIMAGVLQCVKKAVNPPFLSPRSSMSQEALRSLDSSKPNLKVVYNPNVGTAPSFGNPPNVPGYVFTAYNAVKSAMNQSSGASAIDAASTKKQVPGGDTLDRMTFAKNTPVRMMGRNLESFVDEIGNMWVGNALQFYTAEKRMEIMGEQGLVPQDIDNNAGSLIPDGIDSESFVRKWRFKTGKGTLLNVQRNDQIQVFFALRKSHDISRNQLFNVLDLNIDRTANDNELKQEALMLAQAAAAAGVHAGAKGKK